MRDNGFTLIELLVTIGAVSVLVLALGYQFVGWRGKYGVESQVKGLYVDIMNARSRAMQRKRTHFVILRDSNTYSIYEDDSNGVSKVLNGNGIFNDGTGVGADTQLPSFPKTVEFDLSWRNAPVVPDEEIEFTSRGLANAANLGTVSVFIDRDGDGDQDFSPDFGCIVISLTRINLGRWHDDDGDNTYECEQR